MLKEEMCEISSGVFICPITKVLSQVRGPLFTRAPGRGVQGALPCGLSRLMFGVDGWVQEKASRAVLSLTRHWSSIHCEGSRVTHGAEMGVRRPLVTIENSSRNTNHGQLFFYIHPCAQA